MIESFYLYILSAFFILAAYLVSKKEIIFLLYTIQTLACLFYTYIYEAGDYTNHFFIIIALSFLESEINYSGQNAKTFFLKMLLNLSFYILLTEEFAILCGLAIILTDLNINMRLKSNTGDWLKNTYAIVFRSLILLFFLSLIILSSGSLSFNVTIQNKNLAYLAILFGQISIYNYFMFFQSVKEFKEKFEGMTNQIGILPIVFVYAGTLLFILKYLTIMLDQLGPLYLNILLGVNTTIFLYLSLRSIYQFLVYSGKNFNPYRFIRLVLFSFFLIYLTNQESQDVLFKYLFLVLTAFVLYISALNHNILLKNEFILFSLMGILILPFNPLYNFYERGFASNLFEIIIAFSIILISCIMIYSTLNKLIISTDSQSKDFNRSKLAIVYGLAILGLSIV